MRADQLVRCLTQTTRVPAGPAPLRIANGTLEAMKWLALVLMTLDHVNTYLLGLSMPVLFTLGRIAMPLFVFVLAVNLARPGALAGGVLRRTTQRLARYGTLASLPYIALGHVYGHWWPLNILFTLLIATIVIGLLAHGGQRQSTAAVAVFVLGGSVVEYWWFALGLAIACWCYCQRPTVARLTVLGGAMALLWFVNGNFWALAALPLILVAPYVKLSLPRLSCFFYIYYPGHLVILVMLQISVPIP